MAENASSSGAGKRQSASDDGIPPKMTLVETIESCAYNFPLVPTRVEKNLAERERFASSSQQGEHNRRWSGGLPELFLQRPSPSSSPSTDEPTSLRVVRRNSLEEERQTYHDRNRKFLEQALKEKSKLLPPPGPPPMSLTKSPRSIKSKSRKTLEAINEDQQSFLLPNLKKDKGNNYNNSYDSKKQKPKQQLHFRINSDELSALSNGSAWSPDSSPSNCSSLSKSQRLRLAQFEQQQQEQFNRTKEDLSRKLSRALSKNNGDDGNNDITGGKNRLMSEKQQQEFIQEYMRELERERESLLAQWRAEWEAERQEVEMMDQLPESSFSLSFYKTFFEPCLESLTSLLATVEVFLANLPLTIGAVGLSWVTMGTVWFKYMEENVDFCVPVHFYSPRCTFPEYPGCFECDTTQPLYQLAVKFHFACSIFAGTCCVLFMLKVLIAWQVVADELSNPTTSTPMGVVCIAIVCVFAGQGAIGQAIVVGTSIFHLFLSFWFLYMAIYRFGLYPDPGWFPSTVGLTYAAVKTWLYFPAVGLFLLGFGVVFFFAIFFVSVVRVALNKKIAAPVCWIGLSAPSITMYALTLVAQPTPYKEELLEQDSIIRLRNHDWMVHYYLPFQHLMMILSLIGLASAVHALIARWENFKTKPFSPAHVAFCFPTLSHTNAVQAYRGAVDAFSSIPPGSPFKVALYCYWVAFLVGGTALNLIFTYMYIHRLPKWTKLDTLGEDEPPAPEDTFVHEMLDTTGAHELLLQPQPFVSPAVLQANEAGALVRVRRGTEDFRIHGPYIRTRRVMALGFDPTMDDDELRRERAELLDWVAKNAPRKRNRTMSNPLILQARGQDGIPLDIYGTFRRDAGPGRQHKRSRTYTAGPSAV